ncbi:MAG: nuclear transport factor 2 family protein [Candidatus Sulfotelmatobacter sp.]
MTILRRLVIWSVMTATLSGVLGAQEQPAASQDAEIEKEILSIEALKNDAMQKGDAKVLDEVYTDSLIFVDARGKVLTKQDRIKEFASGSLKYNSFRQGDYRFHIYGNTAVVTGVACSVVDHHGSVNQTPRRFTSVYVKLDGHWRFVAHQATLVTDSPPGDLQYCNN